MSEKTTHFGRAGEFYAMSELLLRGWNVAVPVVDVGDDVFVIDDNEKETYRVQIKSAEPRQLEDGSHLATFRLSRSQLKSLLAIELFYIFLVRVDVRWRFVVISREKLAAIRERVEIEPRSGAGRPALTDDNATTDALNLTIVLGEHDAIAWGTSLNEFLDQWPADLPAIPHGPGARTPSRIGNS